MQDLSLRSDFAGTADGRAELVRLIQDVFDVDVSSLDRLGHDPSIMSFGWWCGKELIANVSLYERCLWLHGKKVAAFGVQSVAVRPSWRGRGLFADLMRRALDYADARAGLVILTTSTPDLYRPFGFRKIIETLFIGLAPASEGASNRRELLLDRDEDADLLRACFALRAPVSLVASACDHPALFMLRTVLAAPVRLFHLPDLDAIVALKNVDEERLVLLDLVASEIPSLARLFGALGFGGTEVELHLTPDRLAWTAGETHPADNRVMVRGPFAPENQPFMLSTMHA